jgi:hypothetical protein
MLYVYSKTEEPRPAPVPVDHKAREHGEDSIFDEKRTPPNGAHNV